MPFASIPQANPVRLRHLEPGSGASPRTGSVVVTPTPAEPDRADWRLAAVAFALTLLAVVAVSL